MYPEPSSVSLLGSACCGVRCFASLTLLEVEEFRTIFQKRTLSEQNQFILDAIAVSVGKDSLKDKRHLQHNVNLTLGGKQLCIVAFTRVLGISRKRFNTVKHLYLDGVACTKPRIYDRRKSVKHSIAVAWMDRYLNRIGDKMPHLEQTHLPHFLSKKTLYELMVQHLLDEGIDQKDIVSSSHFYLIWREEFRNYVIPKVG